MSILKVHKKIILKILIYLLILGYITFNAIQQFDISKVFKFSGFIIIGTSYLVILLITRYLFNFFSDLFINKNQKKIKRLKVFLMYSLYLFLVMVLIKKIFNTTGQSIHGDMLTIANRLKNFEFYPCQGWYASVLYFMSYILFPKFLSNYSVVILQILFSSVFFTYVYNFLEKYGEKKFIKIIWIVANIIFPAAFFNQLCMRLLWFAQIVIVLGIQILLLENNNNNNNLIYMKIILLTALVGILRPEAVVYIPFIILFIFFLNKDLNIKKCIVYTMILMSLFLILRIPQKDDNEYKSTAIFNPLSYLVSYDNLNWGGV